MTKTEFKIIAVRRAIEMFDAQQDRTFTCFLLIDAALNNSAWVPGLSVEQQESFYEATHEISEDYRSHVRSLDRYPKWWNGSDTPENRVTRRAALVAFLQHLESLQ